MCRELGWRIDESIQDAPHWKGVYLKAKLRMMQLKDQEAFETSSLIGHSARVYALYYKDGLLCTGTLRLKKAELQSVQKSSDCLVYSTPDQFHRRGAIGLQNTQPVFKVITSTRCLNWITFAANSLHILQTQHPFRVSLSF